MPSHYANSSRLRAVTRVLLGITIVAWLVGAFLAVRRIMRTLAQAVPLDAPWLTAQGTLLDFRDLIVHPGRFLAAGGNPYNHVTYLTAYPQSMEFDPYAPAWLNLSFLLGSLPAPTGAAIYLALTAVVAALWAVVMARWAFPRHVALVAGLFWAWMQVWTTGIGAQESGSALFAATGWVLAVAVLRAPKGVVPAWAGPLGIVLACLKPQFGLPLIVVVLALGGLRLVVRGLVALTVLSLPPLIACVVAEGGIGGFARAILSVAAHAGSVDAPTGLSSPVQSRIDLAGVLARSTGIILPTSAQLALLAVMTVIVIVACRTAPGSAVSVGVGYTLLGIVHSAYDLVLVAAPFLLLTKAWLQNHRDILLSTRALAHALPVSHSGHADALAGASYVQGLTFASYCLVVGWVSTLIHVGATRLRPLTHAGKHAGQE